ncbi:MAG: CPBP family intramembrane metalloprotease [Gammaproteobacteria bacterium]|nr:CPBP family intramembrane metalloprotease [Gammaproteobacteria bacterium]MDH4313916.1 CPBP family intramembrane metalloprotease [Gammaproteobacteria bacterium]
MKFTNSKIDEEWFRVPLAAILLFETAAFIAHSYFRMRLLNSGYDANVATHLSYFVVPLILAVLMYPVLQKHGHRLLLLFRSQMLSVRVVVIGVGLGLVLRLAYWGGMIAMTAFGLLLVDSPTVSIGPQLSWQCPPVAHLFLGIFVMALSVPLIEESVFRGLILHRLSNHTPIFAILVSSLVFAIIHNVQTIFPAFVIGVYFAFATRNSCALWISVCAHSSYNLATQFDWRCLNGQWIPSEVTQATVGVGTLATALLVVSLLLAALLVSKRLIGPPEQPDESGAYLDNPLATRSIT